MSAPGRLDTFDTQKILKGALIAGMGAVLAYIGTDVIPVLPAQYQTTAPLLAILVNIALKLLQDTGK